MQVECLHFEAYVHVCTIMWRVVFKELRGLTNSKVTVPTLTLTLTLHPNRNPNPNPNPNPMDAEVINLFLSSFLFFFLIFR
jgi:predicted component of type VI protein secretion system